jgi:hypothetical protein
MAIGCFTLLVAGALAQLVKWFDQNVNATEVWGAIGVSAVVGGGFLWVRRLDQRDALRRADAHAAEEVQRTKDQAAERRAQLVRVHGEDVAEKILAGRPWLGATTSEIRQMLGTPSATDETVLKSETKQTLKYDALDDGKYSLEVMTENGVVVGWKEKK